MNLPVGELLEHGVSLEQADFKKKAFSLMDSRFSGYIALTIEGSHGLEEAILLFRQGVPAGAFYTYFQHSLTIFGLEALKHCMNASKAQFGVLDVNKLSGQQVELVLAFNDKVAFEKKTAKRDIERLVPKKFDSSLEKQAAEHAVETGERKESVFEKFGLAEIMK